MTYFVTYSTNLGNVHTFEFTSREDADRFVAWANKEGWKVRSIQVAESEA